MPQRRWVNVLLSASLTLASSAVATAQEAPPVQTTKEGVVVDFQDADLRTVVTALAEAGELNVVYGDLPARRVTLRMRQPVPLQNIPALLRSLAQSNGLRVTDEGAFLRLDVVGPGAAQVSGGGEQGKAGIRLFVYRLKHARAARLGSTLQAIFGGRRSGREGREGSGFSEPSLSEGLRDQRLPPAPRDSGGPQVSVELGDTRPSLPGQLQGEVQIVPDEATNALLVRAQPADWEIVEGAIKMLDLRPLQVLIEVLIAEVRRNNDASISVLGTVADRKADPTIRGGLPGLDPKGLASIEVLKAGTLDIRATLAFLASKGQVKILSRPVVLAQNNQEAKILIGSERPFVQASRSLPTDAGVRDQVIQYRDVGTKLTIVPTINEDGYVNLQVLQEVSTATDETQFGAPIISTREASTHLFVRNGQTAVIGGLIDRQTLKTRSGIPILMDIPVLGHLFGTTRMSTANSELFLFLTPHIVTTDEDAERLREGVERSAPMIAPILPEQPPISPGIDEVPTGSKR
jgi:general secretion pathway protein D